MHTPSRLAGAFAPFALPVLLAGCSGVAAVVDPAVVPAPAAAALQPVAPAPVTLAPTVAVQPAPVAPVVAYGSSCFAGLYRCRLPVAAPLGSQCTCPALGGPSYGSVVR